MRIIFVVVSLFLLCSSASAQITRNTFLVTGSLRIDPYRTASEDDPTVINRFVDFENSNIRVGYFLTPNFVAGNEYLRRNGEGHLIFNWRYYIDGLRPDHMVFAGIGFDTVEPGLILECGYAFFVRRYVAIEPDFTLRTNIDEGIKAAGFGVRASFFLNRRDKKQESPD